jgi:hypothetical protein
LRRSGQAITFDDLLLWAVTIHVIIIFFLQSWGKFWAKRIPIVVVAASAVASATISQ